MRTPDLKALMAQLHYSFRDEQLLLQALTHRSYGAPHYERLEFLGDGLLNGFAASLLYRKYPLLDEGRLTRLRALLVRGQTLAEVGQSLGLQPHLRLGLGELRSGVAGLQSILADVVEALIGAIYLDGGWEACASCVSHLFMPWIEALPAQGADLQKDPKSALQEWLQARQQSLPTYELKNISGPDHQQSFEVLCYVAPNIFTNGVGPSRRVAEQIAAAAALEKLKNE